MVVSNQSSRLISENKEEAAAAPAPATEQVDEYAYGQFAYELSEKSEDLEAGEEPEHRGQGGVTFSGNTVTAPKTGFLQKLTSSCDSDDKKSSKAKLFRNLPRAPNSFNEQDKKSHFSINRYLSTVSDHPERKRHLEENDAHRLYNAMADAGQHSLGVVAMSVWILNEKTGKLESPPGAWWREPSFVPDDSEALARLEDTSRADYLPLTSIPPGVGIAGERWANTNKESTGVTSIMSLNKLRKLTNSSTTSLNEMDVTGSLNK
jgi:hypothetical protein